MAIEKITLQEINTLDQDHFVQALTPLFEGPPWIVTAAWYKRPFADLAQFQQTLSTIMYAAPVEQQVALLRAHPDLVGRAALAGTLSPSSTNEQAAAGLDRLSPEEIATFTQLNAAYHERFGFPFVICARENKKDSILAGFASRLQHTREQEISIALAEVAKICSLRLHDLVQNDNKFTISYGKARVPVYRVYAHPLAGIEPIPESQFSGRENILFACEVDVEVFGNNFLPAYIQGDNTNVVATDSMKNFVLRQALAFEGATLEGFLVFLGRRFLETYAQMERLQLTVRELPFATVRVPQQDSTTFGESDRLFSRSHADYTWTTLEFIRSGVDTVITAHRCGRIGFELFKVTGSAFTNFVRDEYTTLPERVDRPLFIALDVFWKYADTTPLADIDHLRYVPAEQVRDLVQSVFHEFVSESIQHLVHEMGQRILARFPQLVEVSFEGQNRTRDLVVATEKAKVYTDPFSAYGVIKLTISRNS